MKKTVIALAVLALSVILLFTGCTRNTDNDKNNNNTVTTTNPVTTTHPVSESDSLLTNELTTNNGNVESTSKDSALGDAIEDAAEGAADVNERMARANEDIANGVRNAEENMGR